MLNLLTLEEALIHYRAWLDAELAVSTGQAYSINGRSLTRVHISEIRQQVVYWQNKVAMLQNGRRGARVTRIVPRDL